MLRFQYGGVTFTDSEIAYLSEQPLGRLDTIGPHGQPQNNPVSFSYDAASATLLVGGHRMGSTQKFRNVATRPLVSLVVDDIVSFRPGRSAASRCGAPPRRSRGMIR